MLRPLRLTVLAPAWTLLDVESVAWVRAQLADGAPISIYPGHAPLLAETVSAPLRYADGSGEHALDLAAGILQVSGGDVTVFTRGFRAPGDSEIPEVAENDRRFDRLARQLLVTLSAQPGSVLDADDE